MTRIVTPKRAYQSKRQRFASEQGLMDWSSIAVEWERRTGQRLSRSRVQQIATRAEEKIRRAMLAEGDETRKRDARKE